MPKITTKKEIKENPVEYYKNRDKRNKELQKIYKEEHKAEIKEYKKKYRAEIKKKQLENEILKQDTTPDIY